MDISTDMPAVTVRSVQETSIHESADRRTAAAEHADLTAALMKAYLSGDGAEVERLMVLIAEAEAAPGRAA